jgi:N utilization substance protein B
MINRRHLRTSVMQALYGLQIDANASLDVALADFEDRLKTMAFAQNKTNEWTAERMAEATAAFELLRQVPAEERKASFFPEETRDLAATILQDAAIAARRDTDLRQKQLATNLEAAYTYYLRLLLLVPELASHVQLQEDDRQGRRIKPEPATAAQMRLANNAYAKRIGDGDALKQAATRRGVSWDSDADFLRRLLRDGLEANPYYQEYLAKEDHTPADDLRLMRWLLRVFLVNSPIVQDFFEEENFAYSEIKAATLHLLQETLKAWQNANGCEGELPLQTQGEDWADAKLFLSAVFTQTLQHRPMLLNRLAAVLANWDLTRVAVIDSILIQMALAEMIEFSSIPIKVSINEYLEIAKLYSTPQSQAFINGVLDKMSGILVEERVIRKSGRGLIDTK